MGIFRHGSAFQATGAACRRLRMQKLLLEKQAGQCHPFPQACRDISPRRPFFSLSGREAAVDDGYDKSEHQGDHPYKLFHFFSVRTAMITTHTNSCCWLMACLLVTGESW